MLPNGMPERIADRLSEMFSQGEEEVDLAKAAATLALPAYPDLDFAPYIRLLDEYAEIVRGIPLRNDEQEARVSAINTFMYRGAGFAGNYDDYHDPRNSFLNDVMDRRKGIPVSLSVIYLEIARRLELPIYGVGLPAHFLVKYESGRRRFFIDPFDYGRTLNRQGCRRLIRQLHGGREVELTDLDFQAVTKRRIIVRMAANLRDIYLSTRQFRLGIEYLNVLIALGGDDKETLRVRAWAQEQRGRTRESIEDMEAYLERFPDSEEADETRTRVGLLKTSQVMLN